MTAHIGGNVWNFKIEIFNTKYDFSIKYKILTIPPNVHTSLSTSTADISKTIGSIIKLLLMKNVKLFKMKNQYYCIIMGTLMIFWRNPPKTNFWVNFSIFDPLFCTQFLSPQFLKKGQLYDFDSWPSYGSYIWLPLGTLGFALLFWNWQ